MDSSTTLAAAQRAFAAPEPRGVPVALHGLEVTLRPLGPEEPEAMLEVFDGLSDDSRFQRFLTPMPRLPASVVASLAAVDGCRHVAWVAEVDGRAIGIARYLLVDPVTAEVAVEVVDAFHGRGVGSALIEAVTTVAAARGVRSLQATLHSANERSAALLSALGLGGGTGGAVREVVGPFHLPRRRRVDRSAVLRLALGRP